MIYLFFKKYRRRFVFQFPNSLGIKIESCHYIKNSDGRQLYKDKKILCTLQEGRNYLVSCIKLTDLTLSYRCSQSKFREVRKAIFLKFVYGVTTWSTERLPLTSSLIPSPSPCHIKLNLETSYWDTENDTGFIQIIFM